MKIGFDGMLLRECQSGVEGSIRNLAQALNEHGTHGYEVYLPETAAGALQSGPRMNIQRVPRAARMRITRIAWEQLALPRRLVRDACDLLHAPGYLAPLRCPVPVVVTAYDVMALTQPQWCRRANRLNYRAMLPASLRRATAIIVPSEFTAREIAGLFPALAEKVHVIPLALHQPEPLALDDADARGLRERLGVPPRFILGVGREEPKKNITGLLEAFHMLRAGGRNIALVLAGPPGASSRAIEQTIHRLGLQDHVIRLGFAAPSDLAALYSLCSAFAFLSLYEGYGLPPLEAMSYGKPVVCSNAGALPETVGDAALQVAPTDTTAAAGALKRVLDDDALRADLVGRGRTRAAASTWGDIARQTEALYESVLETANQ